MGLSGYACSRKPTLQKPPSCPCVFLTCKIGQIRDISLLWQSMMVKKMQNAAHLCLLSIWCVKKTWECDLHM
jgi:hypothetical protein